MREAPVKTLISFEDYLEFEQSSDVRHEFVDGFLFAMAGASDPHNLIAGNIFSALRVAARGTACRVFQSDMKVLANGKGYYPDVILTCHPDDLGQNIKQHPCLLLEVLSNSTEHIDRSEKWENYQRLNSLKMYVLVHQDKPRVEVYRKLPDNTWQFVALDDSGEIKFSCVDLTLTLPEIFEDVDFSKPFLG
jgi:Uma2 family endonuclease